MNQTKQLLQLDFVTDVTIPIFELGDIDGYFEQDTLDEYIDIYGSDKLIQKLASLIYQVESTHRRIQSDKVFLNYDNDIPE